MGISKNLNFYYLAKLVHIVNLQWVHNVQKGGYLLLKSHEVSPNTFVMSTVLGVILDYKRYPKLNDESYAN
jgi:hypothetical protein